MRPAAAADASSWIVLAITLAIQALASMAVLTAPAMAPALALTMGVSPALIGAYVATLYVGAVIGSAAAGPMVLRYGAVRMSQWGLAACMLGMAIQALWPTPLAAVASALITGFGYGPITPASSHLLARSTPAHRVSLVFSIKQTGVPLGGVLAGVLVPPIAVAVGVNAALWSVAAACLVCLLIAQPLRASLDADRQAGHAIGLGGFFKPIRLVARHPQLGPLALVSFVFSAMQMCLASYIVTYLNEGLGYTLLAAGGALAAAQVGGVVGRIAWGWIADRWVRPVPMLALLAVLMAACTGATAALTPSAPTWLVLALLVLFGASATGWNGVYLGEVARQAPPGMAGMATGGSLAFTFFGVVLGPPLFGAVSASAGSYRWGYAAAAIPTLLCAWQLWRTPRRGP